MVALAGVRQMKTSMSLHAGHCIVIHKGKHLLVAACSMCRIHLQSAGPTCVLLDMLLRATHCTKPLSACLLGATSCLDWRLRPAVSVARSVSSQWPSCRPVKLTGLLQGFHESSESAASLSAPSLPWLCSLSLHGQPMGFGLQFASSQQA